MSGTNGEVKSEVKSETGGDKPGAIRSFFNNNKTLLTALASMIVGGAAGYGGRVYIERRRENPEA